MNIEEVRKKYNDYQIEMRRYFHQYPEVSEKEYETSKKIKEELTKEGIPFVDCGLETGVLATIKGKKEGKTFLIRGDIDGLTVPEETGLPYASKNEGVMHACGHDCHISMLLTAAKILWEHRDEINGTIKVAFQPAEEVGAGAKSMIEQGALEGVDGCFAIHVWSTIPSGHLSCEPGPRMAAVDKFTIDIQGKGGHAAAPHETVDAAVVTSNILNNLQTISSREVDPTDPIVVTVGAIKAGTRWNVIADKGYMEGTIRTFSNQVWEAVPEKMTRIVEDTAKVFRAEAKFNLTRIIAPTVNDPQVADLVCESAKKIMGEHAPVHAPASMGGEDFGLFTKNVRGALAMLGVGNEACGAIYPQHSPKYCVDENALINGALLYAQTAIDFLENDK